jgi:GT2 family glycosyltransferase/glycosyltransferase involved in cell wall biosynthesis
VDSLPFVSVLVVNLDGHDFLTECLDSLAAQDYPSDRVEIILVDNGSRDDSVALVRGRYPAVKIIEAGRNLGFAGGNNLGARFARGDYLALINNDARADSQWLKSMVEALEADPQVTCAASMILSEDGRTIDFIGSSMNPYGRAFHVDEGLPATEGLHCEQREVLAPCGGAMMIRGDAFQAVGGFDEDYLAYYEDVDLGWRLWLYGYKVLFVPRAVVYHRQHQTGLGFPVEQRYALSELNALRTVIKNYEEQNLFRMLSLSLFMGVKRSLDQARLPKEEYRFGYPFSGDPRAGSVQPEPSMTRVATAMLVAIDRVADEMPRLLAKRERIQAGRVRSDAEIFARFPMRPDNWVFPWRQYTIVHDQLAKALKIPEDLQPRHGTRLLIITHETIGPKMAGPGIRAWELACALSERFDVTLAARGQPDRSQPGLRLVGYSAADPHYRDLQPYISNTDVILTMAPLFARIPGLRDVGKPAIVDLYDPFELEKLAQSAAIDRQFHEQIDTESALDLPLASAIGDFFICASERQRDFWLGVLLDNGRLNTLTYNQDPTLRTLIDVVPFGIPDLPPQKQQTRLKGIHPGIGPRDKLLLWNGGLWQWFDPLTLIEAMAQVTRVRDDVRLYFAAGSHFDLETVPEMPIHAQVLSRCRELDLLDRHVFFGDWIPYDERGAVLLEADLGVSMHHGGLESRFSSRTRLLDCIWAGLPVIATAGDPLSEIIAENQLGYVLPPGRPDLLAQTILEALADEGLRDRVAAQAEPLRGGLSWKTCIEPIVSFLGRVAFAPDALGAAGRAAQVRRQGETIERLEERIAEMDKQIEELQSHIAAIRRGRFMRLSRAVRIALGRE